MTFASRFHFPFAVKERIPLQMGRKLLVVLVQSQKKFLLDTKQDKTVKNLHFTVFVTTLVLPSPPPPPILFSGSLLRPRWRSICLGISKVGTLTHNHGQYRHKRLFSLNSVDILPCFSHFRNVSSLSLHKKCCILIILLIHILCSNNIKKLDTKVLLYE